MLKNGELFEYFIFLELYLAALDLDKDLFRIIPVDLNHFHRQTLHEMFGGYQSRRRLDGGQVHRQSISIFLYLKTLSWLYEFRRQRCPILH